MNINDILLNKIQGKDGTDYYLTITRDESGDWFVQYKTLKTALQPFARHRDLTSAMMDMRHKMKL